jgi:hypothetical protein
VRKKLAAYLASSSLASVSADEAEVFDAPVRQMMEMKGSSDIFGEEWMPWVSAALKPSGLQSWSGEKLYRSPVFREDFESHPLVAWGEAVVEHGCDASRVTPPEPKQTSPDSPPGSPEEQREQVDPPIYDFSDSETPAERGTQ